MLRVPINQAEPGMTLAVSVLHPQRGNVLLTAGYMLDELVIAKLCELEVHEMWIEYPDTEQIKRYVSPATLEQQGRLVAIVAQSLEAVHQEAHAVMDFSVYRKTIHALIETLVTEPASASYIIELGGPADSDLRHSSEVTFLSLLLGLKLQGYLIQQRKRLRPTDARDVVSLGLGAMMHDIGKLGMNRVARLRLEQRYNEFDPEWRKHPIIGHKMISGAIAPAAAGVVLHHHQHFDGSGFPETTKENGRGRGLSGYDIHVFARIVCVANHFDRLRRVPGRSKLQPRVRVLHTMLMGGLAARFDPVILAALPQIVPAYPPGSIVKLSNGAQAVVVDWHMEAPCQPTVQILPDDSPLLLRSDRAPVQFDLRERHDLLIVECEGEDVSRDNFRLIGLPAIPPDKSAAA